MNLQTGKRVTLDLTVIRKQPGIQGKYGEQTIYSLADSQGQKYDWPASPGVKALRPGDAVTLKATVAEVGERITLKNCRQQ